MSFPTDSTKRIFINDEAELRCGWRIFVFVIFFIVSVTVIGSILSAIEMLIPSLALTGEPSDPQEYLSDREVVSLLSTRSANLVAVVVATGVCARWLERRSFGSVGFRFHAGWSREVLLGCAIGGAAITVAVVMAMLGGAISFESAANPGAPTASRSILLGGAIAALFFLVAAAFEELLFRGFAFQALVHNVGPLVAITLTSALFGMAHIGNPSATIFSTINTVLAGAWLALAYLKTRSLWLPTALHFAWNFVMVFVFGLPVSGWVELDRPALLHGMSGNPEWLSGGSYGPEGGVSATIALILAIVLIWGTTLFGTSDEMRAAIAHGRPAEPERLSVTTVGEAFDQVNRTGE